MVVENTDLFESMMTSPCVHCDSVAGHRWYSFNNNTKFLVRPNVVWWCCMQLLLQCAIGQTTSGWSSPQTDRHSYRQTRTTTNTGSYNLLASVESVTVADLYNYTLQLRKGRSPDICRSFGRLSAMTGGIRSTSRSFTTNRHVRSVVDMLHCDCVLHKAKCRRQIDCFEREFSGPLSRLCDDKFTFNNAQTPHSTCAFLQEAADCKMALMQSACGHVVSSFLYHINALLAGATFSVQNNCQIRNETRDLSGFQYSANCPPIFVDDLETCASRHIEANMLQFRADYNLIAATNDPKVLSSACRAYREYKLCVRPIKKACPRGVELVYNYQTSMRLYRLKMDYICAKSSKTAYASHMSCYHELFEQRLNVTKPPALGNLRPCEFLWQRRLKPAFSQVTAYQFYCEPMSFEAYSLTRLVRHLSACYETSFAARCGQEAGQLVAGLVDRAFTDPRYTRYRYRPDCDLHRRIRDNQVLHTTPQRLPPKSSVRTLKGTSSNS